MKLTEQERDAELPGLLAQGWELDAERDALCKSYHFKDFTQAFGWMTQAAFWAEKWDHHPEWFNVYARVDVVLTTHDAGGLSTKDLKLAQKLDALAP